MERRTEVKAHKASGRQSVSIWVMEPSGFGDGEEDEWCKAQFKNFHEKWVTLSNHRSPCSPCEPAAPQQDVTMDNRDRQLQLVDSIVALKRQLEHVAMVLPPPVVARHGGEMRTTAVQTCESIIADWIWGWDSTLAAPRPDQGGGARRYWKTSRQNHAGRSILDHEQGVRQRPLGDAQHPARIRPARASSRLPS